MHWHAGTVLCLCESGQEIILVTAYILSNTITLNNQIIRQHSLSLQPAEMLTKNERTRTEIKTGLVLEKFKVYFKASVSTRQYI